jgi:hypothetical protein
MVFVDEGHRVVKCHPFDFLDDGNLPRATRAAKQPLDIV